MHIATALSSGGGMDVKKVHDDDGCWIYSRNDDMFKVLCIISYATHIILIILHANPKRRTKNNP